MRTHDRHAGTARRAAIAAALSLLVPAGALACDLRPYLSQGWVPRAAPSPCPADPADRHPMRAPDRVITGEFSSAQQGSYVMLPFRVPRGIDAVRVRYCYDQPDQKPPGSPIGNTLDLGLYEARSGPRDVWDGDEFRGWGGSSHPDVTVSPNGFSGTGAYIAHPKTHVLGRTTRGFRPGSIPAGQWAVELGVASVTPQSQGDSDGKVAWRVEIDLIRDRRYANRPYRPAPYRAAPARRGPGWYAGDLHVHAEHSSLGDATMRQTFDYAFKPLAEGGAGLDFITLSDYVTDTAWGEIGRHQRRYPGKLIERSAEVITYRGHANNHGSHRFVDYRTGPVLLRGKRGGLRKIRPARPASRIFDAVHRHGGWTQINHPTIFPSEVPGFSSICRGCPWDYGDAETRYRKVDAIEIATGPAGLKTEPTEPGPNPFTVTAVEFYESALASGARIAAVGVSDSHRAGSTGSGPTDPVTQAPIGQATTVIYAPELSESGIAHGISARHTYVKVFGNDAPDLRLDARAPDGRVAIIGDLLRSSSAEFTARVIGAASAPRTGPYVLEVLKDGAPIRSVPVVGDDFRLEFASEGTGRYGLQLLRLGGVAAIEGYTTPIWLDPTARPGGQPEPLRRGRCANPIRGGPGRDLIRGTRRGDRIAAFGGADRIVARAGVDCGFGGRGGDRIAGGPGRDRLFGGPGRDRLITPRQGRDFVDCGPGRDRAWVGFFDRVRRCEVVRRR
jgi:hypothetical protein